MATRQRLANKMIGRHGTQQCVCAECMLGSKAFMKFKKDRMKTYGFYILGVCEHDDETPYGFNIHTCGLEKTAQHLDFQIVLPIDADSAMDLLTELATRVVKGHKFVPGQPYSNVLVGQDVAFYEAIEGGGHHRVLRVIIPDMQKRLKKEEMDKQFARQYE